MKPKVNRFSRALQIVSVPLVISLAQSTQAATYQWDTNGSAAGLGGTGNWADSNWDDTASGANDGTETPVTRTFVAADTALFGGTAGTVTVSPGTVVGTLKFDTTGYTLSGGSIALDTASWAWGTYSTHDFIVAAGNTATINSNLTQTGSKTISISSGVSGAGTGTGGVNGGTVVLGGANTFTNEVYVCGATLEINSFTALNFGSSTTYGLSLRNWEIGDTGVSTLRYTGATTTFTNYSNANGWLIGRGKFVFDITQSGTTLTLSRPIISNNNVANKLEKTGAGTLNLTGNNTYGNAVAGTTGATIISGGTLEASGGTAIPDFCPVTIADAAGATLKLSSSESIQSLAGGGASGGAVDLQANTLTITGTASTTFGGVISGTGGALTKPSSNTGTLTLAGANTYTGATTVNGGTLKLTGSLVGPVSLAAGTTLSGNGAVGGAVTSSGIIDVGVDSTPATLTLNGGLNLGGGSLKFDVSGASSDTIAMDGDGVTVSGPVNILVAGVSGPGTYTILSGASGTIDTTNLNASVSGGGAYSVVLDNSTPGSLIANVLTGSTLTWNGSAGNETWDTGVSTNWLNGAAASVFAAGDIVNFTDAASGKNVTLDTTLSPSAVTFDHTADYWIAGAGGIAGSGSFTKKGTGTLLMSTNNTYLGDTTIEAGTLRLDHSSALGSTAAGTTVQAAATLDLYGLSVAEPLTLSGSLVNTFDAVSATLSGAVVLSGTSAKVGGTQPISISGVVSGTGSLTKVDSNTLTLSAANTFIGGLTISAGTVACTAVNAVGASAVVINDAATASSNTGLLTSANIARNITVANQGTGTVTIGSNGGTGNIAFGGILTLNKATIITGGSTDRTTYAGKITGSPGLITVTGGHRTLFEAPDGTNDFVGNILLTGSGTILQTGVGTGNEHLPNSCSVTVDSGAILQLAGETNTSSVETIDALNGNGVVRRFVGLAGNQTLVLGSAGGSGNFAGSIQNGGTTGGLILLTKSGAGTQILSGSNTYTGNTVVNAGTLELASTGELRFAVSNTSSNKITGTGSLSLNGALVIAPAGITATSGSWTLVDASTLSESYGGTFVVKAADGTPWTNASGVWTRTDASGQWTFTQSTGVLTLAPANTFSSWMSGFTFAPGADTSATGDADGDGISNVIENVFGTAPNAPTTGLTEVSGTTGSLVFKHPVNPSLSSNVSYTYVWSTDLSEWRASGESSTGGTSVNIGATTTSGVATVTATVTAGSTSKVFARIQATVTP